MSVIIPPIILGLEMAAPILWARGIFWFFLQENPHALKIPRFFWGGVVGFLERGGEVQILILCYFACSPEEFCEYLFGVCLGILHWKMAGIFGEFFLVSVSHETKHEKSSKNSGKIRSKIRGKIRDENSKNSGDFRSATFLT